MQHYKILITGLVQGVFFRAFTQSAAKKNHIVGSVKNLEGGRVEVIASGEKDNMQKFLLACNKGPLFASVKQVELTELANNSGSSDFIILYT